MTVLFFILLLSAGVCFGLAANRTVARVEFLGLGLLLWVLVDLIKVGQNL